MQQAAALHDKCRRRRRRRRRLEMRRSLSAGLLAEFSAAVALPQSSALASASRGKLDLKTAGQGFDCGPPIALADVHARSWARNAP